MVKPVDVDALYEQDPRNKIDPHAIEKSPEDVAARTKQKACGPAPADTCWVVYAPDWSDVTLYRGDDELAALRQAVGTDKRVVDVPFGADIVAHAKEQGQ